MSDMFWENEDEAPRESNAMKALREKAEADSKTIREMAERLAAMEKRDQEARVASVITSKGLDPKVAALAAAAGVEADEQAVEAWLKDYGDVFARKSGSEEPTGSTEEQHGESGTPTDEQVALAAMAAAAQGNTPAAGMGVLEQKIQSAESAEDLLKILGAG